jgi:hypothetical protein
MILFALACIGSDDNDVPELEGIAALGWSNHTTNGVVLETFATADDGLSLPRDLAFNPDVPGELWVVNRSDDSVTIISDAGTDNQSTEWLVDPYALHFMEEPSSIAFGAPGTFGTCQESRNTYNDQAAGNNFMGPTLWSSDPDIFAHSNEEAIDYLTALWGQYADLGSHLDMLHESPDCMGIAWDHDNVYWVYDGFHDAIARYDFAEDHGPGYDDHSDGVIGRYGQGEFTMKKDTPSHMELDHGTGLLYIADTGNNRVAILDTNSGDRGDDIRSVEPGVDHYKVENAVVTTFLDGLDEGWEAPAGLDIHEGVLYVGDRYGGAIYAYDIETGELIDWLDTGVSKLHGIEVVSEDEIWMVDAGNDLVLRLTPKKRK